MRRSRLTLAMVVALAAPALAAESRRFDDPFEAYQAGDYDEALRLFLDTQVENPTDPRVDYDIGNAQYRRGDYQAAAEAYARALAANDPSLRARASYNLGNSLFRAQKLDEAVKAYEQSLGVTPDDEDARFNLDLAKRLIEEQQQQQQKQDGDRKNEPEDPKEQQQQDPKEGKDSQGKPNPPQQGGEPKPEASKQGQQQGAQQQPGADDAQRHGAPGASPRGDQGKDEAAAAAPAEGADKDRPPGVRGTLSREEAARYLQQLGDSRPRLPRNQKGGSSSPPAKDW